MSVLAVKISPKTIEFAADTQTTYAHQAYKYLSKFFQVENLIVGVAGASSTRSYFEMSLGWFLSKEILLPSSKEVLELIDSATEGKFEFDSEDELLISDGEKVYVVQPYKRTVIEVEGCEAIGSGANYALGALKAGADVKTACEIACDCNIYCGRPIDTLTVERKS